MKKLYSVRYGSNLYGTVTPTSDIDLKHVILPDLDDLLLGKRVRNVVKKTNMEAFTKNTAEDVDEEFIPLQIFAQDFLKGQTYALELAFSIGGTEAHQEIFDPNFIGFCSELRYRFLTRDIKAMIGFAVSQATLYSNKGERLNTLRTAKEMFDHFISAGIGSEKIEKFSDLFSYHAQKIADEFPLYFQLTKYAINAAGDDLRPCVKLLDKILPFSNTFDNSLAVVRAALNRYGSRADAASIDNVDWKALQQAVRIVDEGITLLTQKKLHFPFEPDYCKYLLSIKRGEIAHKSVTDDLQRKVEYLKELEAGSTLPENTIELKKALDCWLAQKLRNFYGVK